MSLFGKKGTGNTPLPPTQFSPAQSIPQVNAFSGEKVYEIRGMGFKEKELMRLASENPDWNLSDSELIKKYWYNVIIYKYTFLTSPVALVPDPKNKHDPNAIKIIVAGQHIGFVPAESTAEVRAILAQKGAHPLLCAISGGEQKSIKYHTVLQSQYDYKGRIIIL